MVNRKMEITLLTIVWVVSILTLGVTLLGEFSSSDIIKFGIEFVLLSLWTFSVIKRKPNG